MLNRSDAKVGLTAEDVTGALHQQIAVQIPNSLAVPASVNRGVPIVLSTSPGTPSARRSRRSLVTTCGRR